MNAGRRQPGLENRSVRRALARSGRDPQPNVLTDAATPNQLSTQTGGPPAVLQAGTPAQAQVSSTRRAAASPSARQARPMPSAGTWVFFLFVIFTIFRCATRT